jgi:catechol 2,3-dioxygenase-like lactoylglutathione lyase family enzyme
MKVPSIALALVLVPLKHVAMTPQGTSPPFTTTGAFFGVSVADLEMSSRWYQEKFGLRVVMQPTGTAEARATVLEGGGLTVELMQHSKARPLRTAAPGVQANYEVHGIFKAGIFVDDFDRTMAELRRRGVEIAIGPFPKRDGQPANAIVKDNAGNYLQLFGR